MKSNSKKKTAQIKAIVAHRRTCKARGTGLSHYILMDRKSR